MEEQRNANVVLTADVNQYQQQVGDAATSTNLLAKSIDTVTQKLSNINKTAGKSLVGLGAGASTGLLGAAVAAGKFEKNLSTLAAQSAITGKNMGTLEKTVKGLSKDFPISLNQATQLVTMLSQMGVVSEQQINKMSQALTRLSGATGADLLSVSTGLVELGRTMGTLNANSIDKYANSLVNVATGSGVAAQSVLEFSNAIGPVARLAGMTEETVLGVSGAFSKAGADGYAGATAFNRLVYGLTKTLQFGGPELKIYTDLLGQTSQQLRNMDPGEAVVQIFESLNKQGPLAIKTLDSLGLDGLRTIRSIQAVINSGNLRSSVSEAVYGDKDSLATGSEAAFSGLNDQMERFTSGVQTFAINIGEHITKPLGLAVTAATQLMSVMNVIAASPIGGAAAIATGGVAAVAGTVGMGLLAAGGLSKLVTAGMGASVLKTGWGAMRLGQGVETPAAMKSADVLTRPRVGWSRFAPSYLMAQGGYRLGEAMGEPGVAPGRLSQMAALPVRGATWMTTGQSDLLKRSQLMQETPFAQARAVMGGSVKTFQDTMKGYTTATGDATKSITGLGGATRNFASSLRVLGTTYARAGVATAGMATRGVGSAVMGALGPVGMGIIGATAGYSMYKYAQGLSEQRTEDWGTLGVNKYSDAAGKASYATATYGINPDEYANKLIVDKTRKDAATISSLEAELASAIDVQLTDTSLSNMTPESARAYIMSMGYLPKEEMQQIGQDLQARFDDTAYTNSVLQQSLTAYTNSNKTANELLTNQPSSIVTGMADTNSEVLPYLREFSGGPKDWASIAFGGVSSADKGTYEAAVEQFGTQTTAIDTQYGAKAGDLSQIAGIYQLMSSIGTWDSAGRREMESLIAEKYPGTDFNYPGPDIANGPITDEDLKSAIGGLKLTPEGMTAEEFANSIGKTITGTEGYQQVDLGNQEEINKILLELSTTTKQFSEFQKTELGKWSSRDEQMRKAASDDSNKRIAYAQEILSKADKAAEKTGTSTIDVISEAAAQAPPGGQLEAYQLAQQLEQRRFDQNLWAQGLNSWDTQAVQVGRTKQQIGALDKSSDTYAEDLLALEDTLYSQLQAQKTSYSQVILAHREFNVSMARAEEEYQISRSRAVEDFNQQISWAYDDFYRNQERAQYDFHLSQRRAQAEFQRSMDRMVEDAMATVYDPYQRITTVPTLDAENLMLNIEEQNAALDQQEKNLKRLKRAGVSQSTIDFLGLADPENAQQLARLLSDIRMDPKVIKELNKLTEARAEGTGDLVASKWSREYRRAVDDFERMTRQARKDFARNSARAWEDFQIQMDRNQELFTKQMSRMAEDQKRQMDNALEDFERSFKEVVGKFGDVEKRALNILADAGIKVVDTGERQMDRVIASISRKYNFVMKLINNLAGAGGVGGSGGGSAPAMGTGATTSGNYKGIGITTTNSGSSTTAPQMSPKSRYDESKLDKRHLDDNLKKRNKFLAVAYRQLGEPYNHVGDAGPDAFDCSGLVTYSASKVGISLVHSADAQIKGSRPIPSSKAIPGDLVGFDWDKNGTYDHIGIYVGNGSMIHANKPGGTVHVAGVGEQGGSPVFRRIRGLAEGGIARSLSYVGEAGDEAVIPLNNRGHDYMLSMYKAISKEIVREIYTKQLGIRAVGTGGNQYIDASTSITGPITVKADDPSEMIKKIEARKRRDAMLRPSKRQS